MTTRTSYTSEFKRQAIELASREDVGSSRAARDLDISLPVLYRWREQAKPRGESAFLVQGQAALTPQEQELIRIALNSITFRKKRSMLFHTAQPVFFATRCLGQDGTRMGPARSTRVKSSKT